MSDKIRKIKIEEVPLDRSLGEGEGWHAMKLRWVVDEKIGALRGVLGHVVFPPGAKHERHIHTNAEEYVVVLKGRGIHTVGDQTFEIGPGDVTFTPAGEPHSDSNASQTEPLEFFFVYAGAPSLQKTGYQTVNY